MIISIREAARRWHVGRETIYRRQLAGQLCFATIDPPTIEASEMLRVFGEPKPERLRPKPNGNTVALARIEAVCDTLKTELNQLKADVAKTNEELRAALNEAGNKREQFPRPVTIQQQPVAHQTETTAPVCDRGEMSVAEAVFEARQRLESGPGRQARPESRLLLKE